MSTTLSKTNASSASKMNFRRPFYEVESNKEFYEVSIHVPGCNKEGISISYERNNLEILASRKESVDTNWKIVHEENPVVDYKLKLELNVEIDSESISAKTENGILKVKLPIADAAKPTVIKVE